MRFSTVAYLAILRSSMDSWRPIESESDLKFWFGAPVGTARKTRQL